MDKFRFALFWKGYNGIPSKQNLAITRERSIILQIHELKTWLEAYRNPYLHFVDPSAAVAVYTDTHTNTLPYNSLAIAHRGITSQRLQSMGLKRPLTSTPSSFFLHSSFLFLDVDTSGWIHVCSLLASIHMLYVEYKQAIGGCFTRSKVSLRCVCVGSPCQLMRDLCNLFVGTSRQEDLRSIMSAKGEKLFRNIAVCKSAVVA